MTMPDKLLQLYYDSQTAMCLRHLTLYDGRGRCPDCLEAIQIDEPTEFRLFDETVSPRLRHAFWIVATGVSCLLWGFVGRILWYEIFKH
jgi:hypothetical protein